MKVPNWLSKDFIWSPLLVNMVLGTTLLCEVEEAGEMRECSTAAREKRLNDR